MLKNKENEVPSAHMKGKIEKKAENEVQDARMKGKMKKKGLICLQILAQC